MSLQVSKYVIKALQSSESIMGKTEGRIYFVGRDNAAEEEDKIPYVVVMPEGVSTDGSKDEYEIFDTDQVSVMVVAETGEEIMEMADEVRLAMKAEYYRNRHIQEGWPFIVRQFTFSAGAVNYDPMKPCYFQALAYSIEDENKD